MASAFWILEDGRGLASRWTGMAYMLELITCELKDINGAEEFFMNIWNHLFTEKKTEMSIMDLVDLLDRMKT